MDLSMTNNNDTDLMVAKSDKPSKGWLKPYKLVYKPN
jgi:hypothetical protein